MRPKEYERKIYGGHRYNPPIGKKVITGAKIILRHVSEAKYIVLMTLWGWHHSTIS